METSRTWNSRLVTCSQRRSGRGSDFTNHRLHNFFCLWALGTKSKLRWHHPDCGKYHQELGNWLQPVRLGCITDAGGRPLLTIPVLWAGSGGFSGRNKVIFLLAVRKGQSWALRQLKKFLGTCPSSLIRSLKIWRVRPRDNEFHFYCFFLSLVT